MENVNWIWAVVGLWLLGGFVACLHLAVTNAMMGERRWRQVGLVFVAFACSLAAVFVFEHLA